MWCVEVPFSVGHHGGRGLHVDDIEAVIQLSHAVLATEHRVSRGVLQARRSRSHHFEAQNLFDNLVKVGAPCRVADQRACAEVVLDGAERGGSSIHHHNGVGMEFPELPREGEKVCPCEAYALVVK
jgi:hypothetical protein